MGVKDDFSSAGLVVKIAFIVTLVANICNWLSFTTTSWIVTDQPNDDDIHLGLWRLCQKKTLGCSILDGYGNDTFAAVQAFAILGFVALNVGFLLVILYMCWGSCKQNSETAVASAILLIVSAVMWLVAVVVFAADYYDDVDNPVNDLGFSFGLAVCALVLALIAGILMILGRRGGGSIGSQ